AVARAVGVLKRAGRGCGREVGRSASFDREAATLTHSGRDVRARRWVEVAGTVGLAVVVSAADERVELDPRLREGRHRARRRDEYLRLPRCANRGRVAAHEVDAVGAGELLPREIVGP